MKNNAKKVLRAIINAPVRLVWVLALCIVCTAAAVVLTSNSIYDGLGGKDNYDAALLYTEIQSAVQQNYIGEVEDESLVNAAASAMVSSLGDKWSYYMTPSEYEAYKLRSANEYAGIGVNITKDVETGAFIIASVTPDTPAATAGLAQGQVIVTVDGEDVKSLTVDGLRELIQSRLNSQIVIGTQDGGEYTVDCSVIYNNPVTYEMLENSVGYVKIGNFDAGAGEAAIDAVEALLAQGAGALIFDVRDNPGGFLSELIKLLDYILPQGEIFVSVDQNGRESVTSSDNVCLRLDMAVLVNENTYSAAEYFAAALREFNWATLIGAPTSGKGRSQTTIELSSGGAVHISTRKYLTPNRIDLSEQGGLTPDSSVYNTDAAVDAQLNKAKNILY